MTIIKDLILTILFLCMFGVLLCFIELRSELRSSIIQNSITVNSQTRIIENNIELSMEQKYKINSLRIKIMDLREVLLVLQKKVEMAEDETKELKLEIKKLERSKRNLLYKMEKLEEEIKDGQKMPVQSS